MKNYINFHQFHRWPEGNFRLNLWDGNFLVTYKLIQPLAFEQHFNQSWVVNLKSSYFLLIPKTIKKNHLFQRRSEEKSNEKRIFENKPIMDSDRRRKWIKAFSPVSINLKDAETDKPEKINFSISFLILWHFFHY